MNKCLVLSRRHALKLIFLIFYILLVFSSIGHANCNELVGLHEQRLLLNEKLISAWSINKSFDNIEYRLISNDIDLIDKKYAKSINEIFDFSDKAAIKHPGCYCTENNDDAIISFSCTLSNYLRDNNQKQFLVNTALNEKRLADIYVIDKIVMKNDLSYFVRKGPFVQLYWTTLLDLAIEGNSKAIEILLQFDKNAEGFYATNLDEIFRELIEEHSTLLLQNWNVYKKYGASLNLCTVEFSNKLINEYRALCKKQEIDNLVCAEIIDYLKGISGTNNKVNNGCM